MSPDDAQVYASPAARIEDSTYIRQTRLGTAALVLGGSVMLLQAAALAATMVVYRYFPDSPHADPRSDFFIGSFVVIFGGVLLQFVGLLLSIAGALRRSRSRDHAWLGLAINALPVIVLAGVMAFGYSLRH